MGGGLWRPPSTPKEDEDLATASTEPPPADDVAQDHNGGAQTEAAQTAAVAPSRAEAVLSAPQPAPVMPATASPSPQAAPDRGRWNPPPEAARRAAAQTPLAEVPPGPQPATPTEQAPAPPADIAHEETARDTPSAPPADEAAARPAEAAHEEEKPAKQASADDVEDDLDDEATDKRPPGRRKRSFTRLILGDTFVDAPKLSRAASAAAAFDDETEAMTDSMFASIVETRTAMPWRLIIIGAVFISAIVFGVVLLVGGYDGSAGDAASDTGISTE